MVSILDRLLINDRKVSESCHQLGHCDSVSLASEAGDTLLSRIGPRNLGIWGYRTTSTHTTPDIPENIDVIDYYGVHQEHQSLDQAS